MTPEKAKELKWGDKVFCTEDEIVGTVIGMEPGDDESIVVITEKRELQFWYYYDFEEFRDPQLIFMNEHIDGHLEGPFDSEAEAKAAANGNHVKAAILFEEVFQRSS